MSDASVMISVNFSRPFPVFPLDGVVLLPHALLRLFIFEPRYRQMVEAVLDGSGQIAMGVFRGEGWREDYEGMPAIRDTVCVGQIAHHEKLPDGTYRIWLHGVCRARVVEELEPDGERLYRQAMLNPVGATETPEQELLPVRERLMEMLRRPPLESLEPVKALLAEEDERLIKGEPIPTSALLEVVALSVLSRLEIPGLQYRLLEEGDILERAAIIEGELERFVRLLERVRVQMDPEAPRGVTWN